MANELDEVTGPVKEEGRDVNVIEKQIPVKVGKGSTVFIVVLFILGIIPGLIFWGMYKSAQNYLRGLQQKVQHDASQIDNYLEQRVMILKNAASLLDKAVDLDKDTLKTISAYRGGIDPNSDATRNQAATQIDNVTRQINIALENYPDLKAHAEIADAMQQNSYLQREITAAREVYNDTVNTWNHDIMQWPVKMIAAARAGYTTRIPFSTSKEIKAQARDDFFGEKK
jgi:LemA protein